MLQKIRIVFVPGFGGAGAMGGRRDFDHDLTLVCELDRVADEVDQDLPEPGHIADQNLRDGIVHDVRQVQLLFRRLGRKQVQRLLDAGVDLERMAFQLQFPRFDFREIKDVVD